MVTGYNRLFIGPWLRREKSKRKYQGIFIFQKNLLAAQWNKLKLLTYKRHQQQIEPTVKVIEKKTATRAAYLFFDMPHWDNYFDGLKEHRAFVIDLLWKLILPSIREKILSELPPCIGIHIRMGDFRKLREGEIFGNAGAVRTPESYFIELINSIRNIHGADLPVRIFTDGYRHEFNQLFQLKNIEMAAPNKDMVDLLLLSRSKIIITSGGSTFSYWAAFLSEAIVIMHPKHAGTIIRPVELNEKFYYGTFDAGNSLLVSSIQHIL